MQVNDDRGAIAVAQLVWYEAPDPRALDRRSISRFRDPARDIVFARAVALEVATGWSGVSAGHATLVAQRPGYDVIDGGTDPRGLAQDFAFIPFAQAVLVLPHLVPAARAFSLGVGCACHQSASIDGCNGK